MSGIRHNTAEVRRALAGIETEIPEAVLRPLARYANTRLGARMVSTYMRNAKGEGPRKPEDAGPVRIVTGRLARAANARFEERAGGRREGRVELAMESDTRLRFSKIIETPYAAAQDEGASFTVPVTAAMRRFFWAMWYQTREDRWKGMALTKKERFQINIPARPFSQPALDDELPNIEQQADKLFINLIRKRIA